VIQFVAFAVLRPQAMAAVVSLMMMWRTWRPTRHHTDTGRAVNGVLAAGVIVPLAGVELWGRNVELILGRFVSANRVRVESPLP